MKFKKWIADQGGPRKVGKLLKVSYMTVHLWLKSETTPKAAHMLKLVQLGNGAFDYEDIINETLLRK